MNEELRLASFTYDSSHTLNSTSIIIQSSNIPEEYRPNQPIRMLANVDVATMLIINTDGGLLAQTNKTSSSAKTLNAKMIWKF